MGVFDNIANGKYENAVPFGIECVPVDEERMTVREAREHKEAQKQARRDQRRRHHEEDARLRNLFREDLEAEAGLVGHPKAEKLFDVAWEHGHSNGYHDVACVYFDYAELLDPVSALPASTVNAGRR